MATQAFRGFQYAPTLRAWPAMESRTRGDWHPRIDDGDIGEWFELSGGQ